MLSQVKPKHLKKATPLKMNGTPLLKWLVAFCVLDGGLPVLAPPPTKASEDPFVEGSNCDPELLNACGNPLNGLTCAQGNTVGFTCQDLTANKACEKLKKVSGGLKWRKTIVEKWGKKVEKWVNKEKKWEKKCSTSD